jgi:hypothetical protein
MEQEHSLYFVAHLSGVDTCGEVHANTGRHHLIPVELCALDAGHTQ